MMKVGGWIARRWQCKLLAVTREPFFRAYRNHAILVALSNCSGRNEMFHLVGEGERQEGGGPAFRPLHEKPARP